MFDDNNLSKALSEVANKTYSELAEPIIPPDYTEPLDRLNRSSEATNEELRAVNSKLDHAKEEIKALNETVEQLRCELDEERKRAKQAEKKAVDRARWFSLGITLLSVLFAFWLNHH